jgi:hypothetical protein
MPLLFSSRAMALAPFPTAAREKIVRTIAISLQGPGINITLSVVRLLYSPGPITCFGFPSFGCSRTTPHLAVTSAEMRSGKTRLLEILELLVRSPWEGAQLL